MQELVSTISIISLSSLIVKSSIFGCIFPLTRAWFLGLILIILCGCTSFSYYQDRKPIPHRVGNVTYAEIILIKAGPGSIDNRTTKHNCFQFTSDVLHKVKNFTPTTRQWGISSFSGGESYLFDNMSRSVKVSTFNSTSICLFCLIFLLY